MGSDDSEMENRDRVLAPDDLDITDQPEVAEIDDGRYVVSADGPATEPDKEILENPDWLSDEDEDEGSGAPTGQEPSPRSEQSTPADQPNRTTQPTARGGQPSTDRQPDPTQPNQGQPTGQQPNQGQPTQQHPNQGQPTQQQPNQQQPAQQPPAAEQEGRRHQQSTGGQPAGSQPAAGGRQQSAEGQTGSSPHPNSSELAAHDQPPAEPPVAEISNETVSKFLAKELAQGDGDYGFDATLNVEGQVNRGRMTSDDIGETLETLLRWYARQTTEEVDPEVVLGIILAGTDLAVEYPVQSAYATIKQYDLKPDDSIGDLLTAIRKEGSFTVPPSKD
ncbi:DUF7500 family protein [Halohasta salina]|uniref:DUF7500 family protein n=1 Tax=Halohasta salina TaxID=2961621 RepID=UPI0020A544D1|nr:hypothetical protein [Halohasta salina]